MDINHLANTISNLLGVHNLKDAISLIKDTVDTVLIVISIISFGKKVHSRKRQIKKCIINNKIFTAFA